uniref:Uncharacterized protein n=1 Tax=Brassica campestris TaxID=3711 RepID=A0A3P6CDY1_BRACM|nr:unnamed protein product [Brassica rapa]
MRRRGSDLAFGFGSLENRSGGMDVRLLSDGSWWWWSRSGSDLDFGGGFSLFLCLLVLSSRLGGRRCRCFKPVDRSLGGSSELPSVPVRLVCYGFSVAGAHARRPVVGLVNHGCSSRWWRVRDCKYQGLDLGLPPGRFDSRRSLFSPSS